MPLVLRLRISGDSLAEKLLGRGGLVALLAPAGVLLGSTVLGRLSEFRRPVRVFNPHVVKVV